MPTVTEIRDAIVDEMSTAVGGSFATIESEFESGIATAFAEALQPYLGGGGSNVLAEWNETDVSQFSMVKGNGNGGVGSPGDWSFSASTMPGSDMPALELTTNGTNVGEAIWLLPDDASGWDHIVIDWWSTIDAGGGGSQIDLGLVFYYEDNDHYFVVRNWATDDVTLWVQNGASGGVASGDIVRSISENGTVGDWLQIKARLGQADGSTAPWCAVAAQALTGVGSHRGVFRASSANADWLSIGSYAPRVGIYAVGFGTADTEYMACRFLQG